MKKEVVTAVATLAIAVGIGFVMQSSDTAKARYGEDARPASAEIPRLADEESLTLAVADTGALLDVQAIELTSATDVAALALPAATSPKDVQRASLSAPSTLPDLADDVPPQLERCEITASATPFPGAMVQLALDAPCAPNERLTVHHNGLKFTEATDENGKLNVTVPAMAETAVFIMAFSNGDGAVAQARIEDMDQFDRVALQWRGAAGFELHAREFGADYGSEGHVWFGATPNVSGLQSGENGFLMRMGDDRQAEPLLAEIYTFPSGKTARDGVIDLSVEAEVTRSNCGRDVEAQSLEVAPEGALVTRELVLSVPECDAVGSFLVLNNLVSDLKVARN